MAIDVTKETIKVPTVSVDEYALPPDATQASIKTPRSDETHPSEHILDGNWKDYTAPMPKK